MMNECAITHEDSDLFDLSPSGGCQVGSHDCALYVFQARRSSAIRSNSATDEVLLVCLNCFHHVVRVLPLGLTPCTPPTKTLFGHLSPSIRHTCPNQRLWLSSTLCTIVLSISARCLTSLIVILSCQRTPTILRMQYISNAFSFSLPLFFKIQHSEPYIDEGMTNADISLIFSLIDTFLSLQIFHSFPKAA